MQTSINTVIALTLEAIQETDGIKSNQFCKLLNMSPGNWSKVKSGKSTISIDSLYLYTRRRSANLKNFFEVIERLIAGFTGYTVDEPKPYVLVKGESLVKQGLWDCFIDPDLFYLSVQELIKAKYGGPYSSQNLWHIGAPAFSQGSSGGLFGSGKDHFMFAGKEEINEEYEFINSLNWYIDSFNEQWVYKAKEKIESKLRVLAKTRSDIRKVRKKDQNFANFIDKTLMELMTKKIISDGNGNFQNSDACFYLNEVKQKIIKN